MTTHNESLVRPLTLVICEKLNIPNEPYNSENEVLSKFMLDLYGKSKSLKEFKTQLAGMGAPDLVDDAFVGRVDKLITSHKVKTEKGNGVSIPAPVFATDEEDFKDEKIQKKKRTYEEIDRGERFQEPEVGKIYAGTVQNITNYGAFIRLHDVRSNNGRQQRSLDGLCHISAISTTRLEHPSEELKTGQEVFVKITNIEETHRGLKVSLSMKDVDQRSGQELERSPNTRLGRPQQRNTHGSALPPKRLTSPERWEIQQLIASGVLSAKDYPELTEDVNTTFALHRDPGNDESEENVEIELKHEVPPFLQGQDIDDTVTAPIVSLIKKPEGFMNRAATSGSALVKERKEKKYAEQKELQEEKKKQAVARRQHAYDPLSQQGAKDSTHQQYRERDGSATEDAPIKLSLIESEWKNQMKQQSLGKKTFMSIQEQRQSLPVYKMRSELVEAVRANQFLVIVGETGSGKTTQITQYLAEEGFNAGNKMIGCTQPRRVAAVSVAKRVAEEVGCKVGEEVGYLIRFEDFTSRDTKIKYMTDGMLEREALVDPDMSKYSVIMLDEAHERTIATDVLFALLKKACASNPDLKVIVTSATLDAEKFAKFFNGCPIVKIPGKTFPVEVYYTNEPEMDYINASLDTVLEIHTTQSAGDILIFLTGQEEIDTCCEALYERTKVLGDSIPELIILPVYSALPSEMQSRIFERTPPNKRKVIVATNIAETSITIDGIYYVIDPGFVKINAYDPKRGMDSLIISPISQAQANQRKGRAGRTGPGKCYRLYTQSAFNNEMLPQPIPEIQRQNLTNVILMLKAMGINDVMNFDFLDPPPAKTISNSLEELYALEALDNDGNLTHLGRQMSEFPMDPSLCKTLIASIEFQCTEEILIIVAMISVQSIFYRPKDKAEVADQRKAKFHHPHGDHLTLLRVYQQWQRNMHDSKKWCTDNYLHERSLKKAKDVKAQLAKIMQRFKHQILSCGDDTDQVRKALCAGFFKNCAKKDSANSCFKTLTENNMVYMHPSSSLFQKSTTDYLIYHTLLLTTKEYMHCVTTINPNWLVELAPNFFMKNDDTNILSAAKKAERIQPLYNKFDPSQSWRLTKLKAAKRKALGNK